jgi:L-fuculose-phosphate aldolase
MSSFDLSEFKVIAAMDIAAAVKSGAKSVTLRPGVVITPSARDAAASAGIELSVSTATATAAAPAASGNKSASANKSKWEALLNSPEANKIKEEICAVGKKLWQRGYVDGNGGNISYRLTDEAVICTPTLVSKSDLKPEDMSLVDLDGNQLAGGRPRTSEILLHLEIYKSVPEAKSCVHCHPPHATAWAITGRVPPTCIIPEFEVFVGRVAVSPYETPGSKTFAETVVPFAKNHNTILLANHGIICWGDTVTHAEWYVEVLETYCATLLIASQLGSPITFIPPDKTSALLDIKKKLGIPDARHGLQECQLCDMPDPVGSIAIPPHPGSGGPLSGAGDSPSPEDVDAIVKSVTDAVMAALSSKSKT